jgi:hypothetical protein
MLSSRKLGAIMTLMSRIDETYEAADRALADPSVSDIEKREKVHAFLDAGSDLTDLAQAKDVH